MVYFSAALSLSLSSSCNLSFSWNSHACKINFYHEAFVGAEKKREEKKRWHHHDDIHFSLVIFLPLAKWTKTSKRRHRWDDYSVSKSCTKFEKNSINMPTANWKVARIKFIAKRVGCHIWCVFARSAYYFFFCFTFSLILSPHRFSHRTILDGGKFVYVCVCVQYKPCSYREWAIVTRKMKS